MSGKIVVVGSLNVDLTARTSRHPRPGETVLGSNFATYSGGKGANQAVAAARLGAKVRMVGRVGFDPFGHMLLDTLRGDGVDVEHVLEDNENPTGVALIVVDREGQNTIVVAGGANSAMTPEDVEKAEAVFRDAQVLLLQLETPLSVVERAIAIAHTYGLQVVLNPAPAQMLDGHMLRGIDYLLPNQTEATLLSGVDTVQEAVEVLHGMGVQRMVVTLGEQGCLVVDGAQQRILPAYHVDAVDTTAAGDAFAGAFSVALTEGKSLMEAAQWGNAAGALAVIRPGAQPSLPVRAEFEAFLANQD